MAPGTAGRRARLCAAVVCAGLLTSTAGAFAQSRPARPAPPVTLVTYLTPIWTSYLTVPESELAAAVGTLRSRIGEGGALRVGFAAYIRVNMPDWRVDVSSSAAIHAALGPFEIELDEGIRRARLHGIPFVVGLMTAGRGLLDPAQRESCFEDRRVMQWLNDNTALDGWWTHSRYARRQYRLQEAYMRGAARILASRAAQYPETLVAVAGDGEVELSAERLPRLADYSPFAIAEFCDWLRGEGLYARGGQFKDEAYVLANRYRGDSTPGLDTNLDGHTLNGDFGTAFTSWKLRYFDWSLNDPVEPDPLAIPLSTYAAPGFAAMPDVGTQYFDAPRMRNRTDAWWSVWDLFRQSMIWHHNRDLARWMTTTPDDQGHVLSADRWFSYQIPADYLFGGTPDDPNERLVASASPWWTANVAPFGSLGFTSFGVRFGSNDYRRTLPGFTEAVKSCGPGAPSAPACVTGAGGLAGTRWGIFEWNPVIPLADMDAASRMLERRARYAGRPAAAVGLEQSSPGSPGSPDSPGSLGSPGSPGSSGGPLPADDAVYRNEIERLRRYRPTVLAPFAWEMSAYRILDSGFESALKRLATLLKDGWAPTLHVDRTSVALTALRQNGAVVALSAAQQLFVTQPTGGTVSWTVTSSHPWLVVKDGAGHGDGSFAVTVDPSRVGTLPAGAYATSVVVSAPGSIEGQRTVDVVVTLVDGPASEPPFGALDTPLNGSAGLQGSIAVTGWALDDIGVDRVELWRDLVAGEPASHAYVADLTHPAFGKVFIANALFVAGSRPDVEAAHPRLPSASRAGWGYLLLSWGLWHQGNGPYTLYAYAFDGDSGRALLGKTTIAVDNAHAAKPFGGLDTPGYGASVSGGFWNYGWALTPGAARPCTIANGQVLVNIDSGPFAAVDYGASRTDIATAFPGFSNAHGSGGAFYIDTTQYDNGVHQIGWLVTDDCGRTDGVGSRFFTVLNASAGTGARAISGGAARPDPDRRGVSGRSCDPTQPPWSIPTSTAPIAVRQLGQDWNNVLPGRAGIHAVEVSQNGRIELRLPGAGTVGYAGTQLSARKCRDLPLGSSFEASTGTFYWQPAPGFLGAYDLAFEPDAPGGDAVRVRVVVGPPMRMTVEATGAGLQAGEPLTVSGWAVDLASADGPGVDAVHVWAYPLEGGGPIWLGGAAYGETRADAATLYGQAYADSGYRLVIDGLPAGGYDIVVYAHRTKTQAFEAARIVRLVVRPPVE